MPGHGAERGLDLRRLEGPPALDVVGQRVLQLSGPVLVAGAGGRGHGTDCSRRGGPAAWLPRRVAGRAEDGLACGGGQRVLVGGGHSVAVEEEQQVVGEHGSQSPVQGAAAGQLGEPPARVLERAAPVRPCAQRACGGVGHGGQERQHGACGCRRGLGAAAVIAVRGQPRPAVALLVPVLPGGAQHTAGQDDRELAAEVRAGPGDLAEQGLAVGVEEPVRGVHPGGPAERGGLGLVDGLRDRADALGAQQACGGLLDEAVRGGLDPDAPRAALAGEPPACERAGVLRAADQGPEAGGGCLLGGAPVIAGEVELPPRAAGVAGHDGGLRGCGQVMSRQPAQGPGDWAEMACSVRAAPA